MAYRVIFWRPQSGINVWLPSTQPLGETIRREVIAGRLSELLECLPAQNIFERLKKLFSDARVDEQGYLHWSDEVDNGFVARFGEQYLEVCSFDLADQDRDKIFLLAKEFFCEHYDWGN